MEKTISMELFKALVKVGRYMHRTGHKMGGHDAMDTHRIHHGQYHALSLIEQEQGASQQILAEKMDIRPSSMTELLGKLEQAGYVERRKDEQDQRVMRVFITEQGKESMKKIQAGFAGFTATMFDGLTEEEQTQLLELLQKVEVSIKGDMDADNEHGEGRGHRGGHCGHHRHHEHHGKHCEESGGQGNAEASHGEHGGRCGHHGDHEQHGNHKHRGGGENHHHF